ncbi:hypothetical protein Tco_0242135, partial [Tanacetum coccineum]
SSLVVKAKVGGHRMYVDGGSALEVLYEHFLNRLRLEVKRHMTPAMMTLLGFTGEISWPLGQMSLMVTQKNSSIPIYCTRNAQIPGARWVTLHNSTVIPTKCRMVAEAPAEFLPNRPTSTEGVKVVPRSKNKKADALCKIASTSFAHQTKKVLVEVLKEKSIEEKEILTVVEEEGYSWMTLLLKYLIYDTLLAETKKARAIKIKSRQYAVIGDVLYRKSFLEPWLRCVGPLQAEYVVREIHEGSCSMHSGP